MKGRILPEELLTQDDVKALVDATERSRDRALILTLYETGGRIGEVLSLRIRNVQFDEYGAVLIVGGKTGMRRVRIVASSPALAGWLRDHPKRRSRLSIVDIDRKYKPWETYDIPYCDQIIAPNSQKGQSEESSQPSHV